ncbi:MAG: RNA polymerase sigma factor [Thermoleophilaceae bacterium]
MSSDVEGMTALVTDSGRQTPARLAGSAILACQSDERLVSLVRSGHERAFDAIVDRYRRPLLRHCRRILPESRAEDAVQQTFINAHASLVDSDDAVQLKPWLFAIARNASLNMLRQNGWNYEEIPLDFDGVPRPDQIFEQQAQLQQTVSALNDLPERQRSALVMREFEGRSYEEIALALGANDGAVRQLLNRARGALRTAATAVIPPPLVARIASASPPDGRRAAEVLGGLGAAGVAKAGATALVAGTLVVGAVKAPLPLAGHDTPTREKATLADDPVQAKAAAIDAKARAGSLAARTPAAANRGNDHAGTRTHGRRRGTHRPAAVPGSSDDRSGTHHGDSTREGGHDRSGSRDRAGSGDDSHSGSGRSGSDDTRRSSGGDVTRSGGSDDSPTSGHGGLTSGGSNDGVSSGSGSGSDDSLTSGSGSGEPASVDDSGSSGWGSTESGSGASGSGSSGSGSGSSDPAPPTGITDDH